MKDNLGTLILVGTLIIIYGFIFLFKNDPIHTSYFQGAGTGVLGALLLSLKGATDKARNENVQNSTILEGTKSGSTPSDKLSS